MAIPRTRGTVVGVGLLVLAIAVLAALLLFRNLSGGGVQREDFFVAGAPEPGGEAVAIDAAVYRAAGDEPAPAVLLAHGFGGSKDAVAAQAQRIAAEGYLVATYTARGFGASGGRIHLNAPDYEVRDAQLLLDALAARGDVQLDGPGDPRVAVVGGSYGGALALMLAGTDHRVDAIVPMITWHDLQQALFPQHWERPNAPVAQTPAGFGPVAATGVFKRLWAGSLFSAGQPDAAPPAAALRALLPELGDLTACGRFARDLCEGYAEAARTGEVDGRMRTLLRRSSPASVLHRIEAPTLLIQGESDSLFPLSEADANAAGIAADGTPVKSVWVAGGHDTGFDVADDRLVELVGTWLDETLRASPAGPGAASSAGTDPTGLDTTFEAEVPRTVRTRGDRDRGLVIATAPGLPGTGPVLADAEGSGAARAVSNGAPAFPPAPTTDVALAGGPMTILSPAGGIPAAVTTVPGLGELAGVLAGTGLDDAGALVPPGQSATFESQPLPQAVRVLGSPRARLRVGSSAGDATLFASVQVVSSDGRVALPQRLVAPVRVTDIGSEGRSVEIALPAFVRDVPAGSRLRLTVTSTDSAYAVPTDPRTYTVALADSNLVVPLAPGPAEGGGTLTSISGLPVAAIAAIGAGLTALLLALVIGVRSARQRHPRPSPAGAAAEQQREPEPAGAGPIPASTDLASTDRPDTEAMNGEPSASVAAIGLGKAYGDGFRAVADLTFSVGRGQVLGLLGPNGAGKTTTLRMLLGLIHPTEGEIRVFGERVFPGAPVLSRVGALVEGPGLLPHVSGMGNLRAYWQATGRQDDEARFDVALQIAGLGADIDRRVGAYSHGMKQRLAIAQAMLGLPDLLVLDEPTNGLDPPQIAEMREVLRSYAATGRTVLLSSHLLAEVEATCTHVVVMHGGRLVAHGAVADVVGNAVTVAVDVSDPDRAAAIAAALPGTADVRTTPTGLLLRLPGTTRAELLRTLVAEGFAVDRVAPQHALEEAFLTLVGEARR